MPLAATAAASGDGAGWAAWPTIAGRGGNDVTVALSLERSMLDAAENNYVHRKTTFNTKNTHTAKLTF